MLKATIFREYDIRGIAETELTSEGIVLLGQAIGTLLQRRHGRRIALGRDCRLSSPRLRDALAAGLRQSGCHVLDLGAVPTPVLYYAVFRFQTDGAVMITGSHNPPEYNGFKTVMGPSTIHGEDIQHLRRLIETGDLVAGDGDEEQADAVTPYVEEIAAQFSWPQPLKVALDAGNGAAGPVMRRLLEKLNVEATQLFFDMDGRFPHHHPDPTVPENLTSLVDAVRRMGAALGIAFDGDGDRIGAVDEQGRIVFGDQLLLIYAREILSRKPGATFIGEVKCSQFVYDDLERRGARAIMWKTGHSLIKAKMQEERAELAGEMSGHMFFADRYYGFDDALYAACRLMEIVARSGQPLSYQLADMPGTFTTPEIRVDCPDETKFAVVERVKQEFRQTHRLVEVDGARILFPGGWGLVRASNTQPVLVLRFEAATPAQLDEYRRLVESAVERAKRA
jgi:phosphomannomutase/phosphoglucomutase